MKFNKIFGINNKQKNVYEMVNKEVDAFLNGMNSTIFAYGQTGAGKTYTMIGECPDYQYEDYYPLL